MKKFKTESNILIQAICYCLAAISSLIGVIDIEGTTLGFLLSGICAIGFVFIILTIRKREHIDERDIELCCRSSNLAIYIVLVTLLLFNLVVSFFEIKGAQFSRISIAQLKFIIGFIAFAIESIKFFIWFFLLKKGN